LPFKKNNARDKVIVGYKEVERPLWVDSVNAATVERVRAHIERLVRCGATARGVNSAVNGFTPDECNRGEPAGDAEPDAAVRAIAWLPVHVLDLAADGYITPHVDSVKFSGDLVCGVSLLSGAVMTLAPEAPPDLAAAPDARARLYLPRRSLYVLSGHARYRFTHSVDGGEARRDRAPEPEDAHVREVFGEGYVRERRISLIFRDAKLDPEGSSENSNVK
jgi:alkylated DNA repair protein alkB family protein 7